VLRHPKLNHRVDVDLGLLADESSALLQSFFRDLRGDVD
jgi:tRNA(Arg) A34 adenosine deaminase TadA